MRTYKSASIYREHLTQQTLTDYINIRAREKHGDFMEGNCCMPGDVYITTDGTVTIIANYITRPSGLFITSDDDFPKDLIELLNWAIKNQIRYIEIENEDKFDDDFDTIKEHLNPNDYRTDEALNNAVIEEIISRNCGLNCAMPNLSLYNGKYADIYNKYRNENITNPVKPINTECPIKLYRQHLTKESFDDLFTTDSMYDVLNSIGIYALKDNNATTTCLYNSDKRTITDEMIEKHNLPEDIVKLINWMKTNNMICIELLDEELFENDYTKYAHNDFKDITQSRKLHKAIIRKMQYEDYGLEFYDCQYLDMYDVHGIKKNAKTNTDL